MPYVISRLFDFINTIESTVMTHNIFYQYDTDFSVGLSGRRGPMVSIDYIAVTIMFQNIDWPIIVISVFMHFSSYSFYLLGGSFALYRIRPKRGRIYLLFYNNTFEAGSKNKSPPPLLSDLICSDCMANLLAKN